MKGSAKLSIAVETAAWVAGGVLLIAYAGAQWHFARLKDSGLQEFRAARAAAVTANSASKQLAVVDVQVDSPTPLRATEPDTTAWSPGRITAYRGVNHSTAAIAVLRIPSIDLEVPVYAGVTESNLTRGAAWIETTAPPGASGNAGLASHRDGYFRNLREIAVGDRLELQTLLRTHSYVVKDIRIVEPEDVNVLDPSSDQILTLVTCYPFYMVGSAPKRFIVRAHAASARDRS